MQFKKKKPQDIIFQQRGGELVVWKRKRDKSPKVSIFVEFHFISERGGICWELLTDGNTEIVPLDKIELWDVMCDYADELRAQN